jgi:GNAT superfamily N-acetyltransferase
MIRELPPSSFPQVEPVFPDRKQYVPVRSVLRGLFPGKVYVDDVESPRIALVWALTRWAYMDGAPERTGFLRALPEFLREVVFPLSRRMGRRWFELYASPSSPWTEAIETHLSDLGPDRHRESTFVLDVDAYAELRREPIPPPGMELEAREYPVVPETVRSLPFMPPVGATRTSFGYQLVQGEEIIAICRSNGLATGEEFMVEAETLAEAHRGKGRARIVATALLDHAIERGWSPLWETTEDNLPSRRLARSLGFVEAESYPVYTLNAGT